MFEKSAYDKLWDDCMRYSYSVVELKKQKEQLIEGKSVLDKKIYDLEKSLKEIDQYTFNEQVHRLTVRGSELEVEKNAETTYF